MTDLEAARECARAFRELALANAALMEGIRDRSPGRVGVANRLVEKAKERVAKATRGQKWLLEKGEGE